MSNVLFYSPKCPHCQKVFELIEPYNDRFQFLEYVNVSKVPKQHLPTFLRRVPTLILNNGEFVFEGKEVVKWIYDMYMTFETKNTKKKTSSTTSLQIKASNDNDESRNDELTPFILGSSSTNHAPIGTSSFIENFDITQTRLPEPREDKRGSLNMEQYSAQRDAELNKILSKQQPNHSRRV